MKYKGLRPGAGNAGSMKRELSGGQPSVLNLVSWVPSQNAQDDHIWPKPRFSGPEPGFGPDVVTFGALGSIAY